jgi:hypothetical protein
MGKFGIKYSRVHPQAIQVRDAFAAAHGRQGWWNVLEMWYK